jgi:uncharacterized spore protein YtfJ
MTEPRETLKTVREALSARQVFGEPVEGDGVTVIPAATVIGAGGGGGGGGEQQGQEGDATARQGSGGGGGFGLVGWPSGAFEIREGKVTWRPAVHLTRIAVAAVAVALVLARAILATRRRS